jgi:sugar phosphate permease
VSQAVEKHLALWLVFAAGVGASVYGFYLLFGLREVELATAQAAGGMALIAWVMFHPARA